MKTLTSSLVAALGAFFLLASPPAPAAAPTFDNPLTIITTHHADNMVMGDFDGDTFPDVAVVDGNSGDVQVRFGNGAGAFRSTSASFTLTSSNNQFFGVAAAVVYGHQVSGSDVSDLVFATGNSAQVWEWNGTAFAKLATISLTASGISATKVAVGDLTGVGHGDIVVSDSSGSVGIVVIPNDGAGTFGPPVAYAAKGCDTYAKPVIAHVKETTADGFGDVILSHNFIVSGMSKAGVGVLTNKGDGTFNAEVNFLDSAQPTLVGNGLVVADVDYDGHLDLVTVGSVSLSVAPFTPTWYLSVNLGAGDGTFADGKPFQFLTNGGQKLISRPVIDAADLDGDGPPEVVTLINAPGTITSNPIQGFTVTRFTGAGATLALEGQDDYPADFKTYDSIALGYTDSNGTFVTFDSNAQVDVLIGTSTNISSPSPTHSQFLVYQNTTPAAPAQLAAPTLTINGSTTPGAIVTGASLAFASTETETPLGIYVRIQSSTTPNDEGSWTDLPTGNKGHMVRTGGTGTAFTLNTSAYPNGSTIHFRAIAAASGYVDNTSPKIGPFTLQAALSIALSATTTSDPANGNVVQAGDTITYTLRVTNSAGAPRAEHLQITDLLPIFTMKNGKPSQVFVQPSSIDGGGVIKFAPDTQWRSMRAIIWQDVGGLDPGASLTVSFDVKLNDKVGRKAVNVARLNSSIFNTVFSVKSTSGKPLAPADGNAAPSRIPVEPKAGVFFTITSKRDPSAPEIGLTTTLQYTLAYENSGSEDAQNVIVSADVPRGMTFVDGDGGFNIAGKGVNWTVGTVPAFSSGTRIFKMMVSSDATPGAKIAGGCKVTCTQKASDTDTLPAFSIITPVEVTITAAPESNPTGTETHRGDSITYTLSYKNVSGAAVKGVQISSTIPKQTTLAKDAQGNPDDSNALEKGANLSWPLADLANGEAGTRTFRVIVGDKIGLNADVTGNATLVGKDIGKLNFPLPNLTVRNPLRIVLTPALVPNPLHPGDGMILQLTCTNASSFVMNNVKLEEFAPQGTHVTSASDFGAISTTHTAINWNFATLNPGEQRIVSFVVMVDYDVDLNATLFNGNPDGSGEKVILGTALPVDVKLAIARNGFSATADDPKTGKANGFVATGGTPFSFQISSVPPATSPVLSLSQTAVADGELRQDNATGKLPPEDLGDIATVVMPPSPADGLNGQITYHFSCANTGNATAHKLKLNVFVPADTTLTGTHYFGPNDQNQTPVPDGDFKVIDNIITVAIGDLAAGAEQIFSFKVAVNPKRKFGFIGCNGAFLTADDFFASTHVSPDTLTTALVPPVSFDTACVADKAEVRKSGSQITPATVKYTITYTNNGGVQASNVKIACKLPAGVAFRTSTFASGTDATSKPGTVIFSDPTAMLSQEQRTFDLVTNVENAADNSVLVLQPEVSGKYQKPAAALRERLTGVVTLDASYAVAAPEVTRLLPATAARLVIGRCQRASVHPGEYIVYEIFFGNSGDLPAQNTQIGVLIPSGTKLADDLTDANGIAADAVWSGRFIAPGGQATSLPHNFTRKGSIITWKLGALPAHSGGTVLMVVKVDSDFTGCAVQDNSCYISADNAPSRVPGPVSTGVLLKDLNFFGGLWRNVGCFFEGVGAKIGGVLHNQPAVSDFQSLSDKAAFTSIGGSDLLVTKSFSGDEGAYTLPLGGGQVLVVEAGTLIHQDGSGVVATGGGNVVSHDGATLIGHDGNSLLSEGGLGVVAAGGGNLITINGIDGTSGGNLLASQLLANCDNVVAQGGGNIIVARGGNLLHQDGSGLIGHDGNSLLDNNGGIVQRLVGSQLKDVVVQPNAAGVVAAGGGNIVAAGGGNVISNDGGSLIGRAFGAIFSAAGRNGVVAAGGGNVVSHDGATVVAQGGGN